MSDIESRIEVIGDRLSRIEEKIGKTESRGIKKKLTEYGGILALALSILIATFTVFDKVVVQPQKAEQLRAADFRKNINSLIRLTSEIAGLDWIDNFSAAKSQAQILTPQKLALIDSIEKFGLKNPEKLKFSDRLMLANENELFSRFSESLAHAEIALELSVAPMEKANAYWAMARMNGRLKNIEVMRAKFDSAISQFKSMGYEQNVGNVMQVYIQWIGIEIISSESCVFALEVFNQMKDDFNNPLVWPTTRKEIQSQFQLMISKAPKNCGLTLIHTEQ
jgi:hypothetical protein